MIKICRFCRADETIQNVVYKLVPGLYKREMEARRAFYEGQKLEVPQGESGGQLAAEGPRFYSHEDGISMSLEEYSG